MTSYTRRVRTSSIYVVNLDLVFGFLDRLPAFPSLRKLIRFEDMEGMHRHGLFLFPIFGG